MEQEQPSCYGEMVISYASKCSECDWAYQCCMITRYRRSKSKQNVANIRVVILSDILEGIPKLYDHGE